MGYNEPIVEPQDFLRLNILAGKPAAPVEGQMWWDPDDKTISFQTDIGDVVLQVGQESQVPVVNKTGAQLDNGTIVYVSGAQGNRPTVDKAIADGSIAPDVTIGFVTSDLPNNQNGRVTTFGLVRDLDTSGCTEGDRVYVSPTAAGQWTKTRPVGPDQIVLCGYVMTAHATQGVILCYIHFQDAEIHSLPLASTNPSAFTTWLLGHTVTVASAQAISDGSPYVSGTEFCNAQPSINVTVLSAALTLRISGTSVDEATGTLTPADLEDVAIGATGWYHPSKKWIGTPTFTVQTAGQSMTADIMKGRYWDSNNQDFRMVGVRIEWTPSNPSWDLTITFKRQNNDGSVTDLETLAFDSTDSPLWAENGQPGTYKLYSLTHDFLGSQKEGLIVEKTSSNVRYLYTDVKYTHL
jgi:hypothetical protein